MSKKHLLSDNVYVVPKELTLKLGFSEAALIQQIHYWLCIHSKDASHYKDGMCWTYNSTDGWRENFPCWGRDKIKKMLIHLEVDVGVVLSRSDLNKKGYDRTKWYTLNYELISKLMHDANLIGPPVPMHLLSNHSELTHGAKSHDALSDAARSTVLDGTPDNAEAHDQYHNITHQNSQKTTTSSASARKRSSSFSAKSQIKSNEPKLTVHSPVIIDHIPESVLCLIPESKRIDEELTKVLNALNASNCEIVEFNIRRALSLSTSDDRWSLVSSMLIALSSGKDWYVDVRQSKLSEGKKQSAIRKQVEQMEIMKREKDEQESREKIALHKLYLSWPNEVRVVIDNEVSRRVGSYNIPVVNSSLTLVDLMREILSGQWYPTDLQLKLPKIPKY